MAGNWSDPTSWRMALDKDGSKIVVISRGGGVYEATGVNFSKIIDDDSGLFGDSTDIGTPFHGCTAVAVVFPERRDIDAYLFFVQGTSSDPGPSFIQTSVNTTNGFDGTWVTVNSSYDSREKGGFWRVTPTFETELAVKGIRMVNDEDLANPYFGGLEIRSIHIYGELAPGQTVDRLQFWDPALDQHIGPAHLDWGDVPRGGSADKTFRVKNVSPTMSANNVRVSFDILTEANSPWPSVPAQHSVSYNDGPFAAQVNIGSLGPGSISGIITVRRVTPTSAALGHWAPRIQASADTWS